ncbi:hypothetical protein [Microbacterium oleivorans]|uniref:hypothetical protein n=1 Tax=Microbacterium oleivorans TaxID=273677 RepID=UPI001146DAB3|nr:hypothetical protein [Microbacterium oleivorans]
MSGRDVPGVQLEPFLAARRELVACRVAGDPDLQVVDAELQPRGEVFAEVCRADQPRRGLLSNGGPLGTLVVGIMNHENQIGLPLARSLVFMARASRGRTRVLAIVSVVSFIAITEAAPRLSYRRSCGGSSISRGASPEKLGGRRSDCYGVDYMGPGISGPYSHL